MSATRLLPAPSYRDLLQTAYAWGRVDGLLAADFEPPEGAGPSSACCRGREPADFARSLWSVAGGVPPAGLEGNAPHWYARGFEDALAEVRADRMNRPVRAARAGGGEDRSRPHRPLERAWP